MRAWTARRSRSRCFGREEGRDKVPDGAAQGGRGRPAARSPSRAASSRGSCRAGCRRGRASSASSSTRPPPRRSIAQVGERQQRLLRELEKLALEHGQGARSARRRSRRQRRLRRAQGLDARRRAGGRRREGRDRALVELRGQGERLPRPDLQHRPTGCATRSRSPRRSPPASARPGPAGRCGCARGSPTRFIADVAQARRRRASGAPRGLGRPRAREPRRRRERGRPRRGHAGGARGRSRRTG